MATNLKNALEVLQSNNYKLTKQRHSLLQILAEHEDKYIEITKLDQLMRKQYPKMSHNTIYRNVKEFQDIGLVEEQKIADKTEIKFQCDNKHQHHHHFVCNNCGRVQEFEMCPLDFFSDQLPGNQITGHRFELYGICADCVAKVVTA